MVTLTCTATCTACESVLTPSDDGGSWWCLACCAADARANPETMYEVPIAGWQQRVEARDA